MTMSAPGQVNAKSDEIVISVRGVVNGFGDRVIHDHIDLDVKRGEVMGLVGGSGTGKSVLLRTMLGLHKPNEGQVLVGGRDVTTMTEAEKKDMAKTWGVAFQDGALFSGLSVIDNIGLPLREHTKLADKDIDSLALFKLGIVGLKPEAAAKAPSELSGGMVRRAGLARALALDPSILFLDEPTGGVDPVTRREFWNLIDEAAHDGITVFVTTHYMDEAEYCNRVSIMVDGRIDALDTPAGLKKQFGVASMDEVFLQLARKAQRTAD